MVQVKSLMVVSEVKVAGGRAASLSSRPPAVKGSFDLLPFHPVFGIGQPVAFAVGFQDVNPMGQPVQ